MVYNLFCIIIIIFHCCVWSGDCFRNCNVVYFSHDQCVHNILLQNYTLLYYAYSVCIIYSITLYYSRISIIRTMIIRISGLIQTLMNVPFLMYAVHMWLVN